MPYSEPLLVATSLLDSLPDIIVWVTPVFNEEHTVKDFRIAFANQKANAAFIQQETITGLRVVADNFPSHDYARETFTNLLEVWGNKKAKEFYFYVLSLNRFVAIHTQPHEEGLLCISRDRVAQMEAEQKEQKTSRVLKSIIGNSATGIVVFEAVREGPEITDFVLRMNNERSNQLTGTMPEEHASFRQILRDIGAEHAFDLYVAVVETGQPMQQERYLPRVEKWISSSVSRLDDGFVSMLTDITQSKAASEELEKQKNLFDDILKFSSNGISVSEMIRDESGRIIDVRTILVNEAAVQFTGLSKEIYLSKTAVELEPNILQSPYYKLCLDSLETGISSSIQYQLESTGRWLEISISKIDDNRLITIFTDISSTKEAQLSLERSAAKTRAVVDSSQAGVFTGSPVMDETGTIVDFRFTLVNKALAAFTDQEPDALIGELGSRWFGRYKANGLFEALKSTYETGQKTQFDFFYEGHKYEAWINIVITRLQDEIIGTFTDFSSLKKTQLQLERTVEELQRSNTNLQEFAYAASHDLKEPVRKVRIFSDQLNKSLGDRMTEEERTYFNRMDRASARMSSLIDDLLSFSEVSLSAKTFEEVDMNKLMELVISDLDLEIEEKKAVVRVGDLFVFKAYPRQLQQAFQNLIGNALKYAKPDVPPKINITCSKVAGDSMSVHVPMEALNQSFYCIAVADNGVGFEQQDAEKIFNLFTRLHGAANYKGSGIGLSIVRRVIENHNGYVTANSIPGEGSVFMVYLPAKTSEQAQVSKP